MRVVLPSLVKQQPALKVVRATCSYSAAKPEEISFKEGDSVEVLVIDQETGMWEGRVAGTNFAGSFPATHVGDATLIPGPQITAEVKQQARKAHSRKKHKKHAEMVATAAHSFKARTLDELAFSRGEVITIIGSERADFYAYNCKCVCCNTYAAPFCAYVYCKWRMAYADAPPGVP
jgi:hypothetical protein